MFSSSAFWKLQKLIFVYSTIRIVKRWFKVDTESSFHRNKFLRNLIICQGALHGLYTTHTI